MLSFSQRSRRRPICLTLEILEDRTVPTLLGNALFPANNPWNQQITNAPVAANSAAIMSAIIANDGDDEFHPDFSQDFGGSNPLYGIPYNIVHGNTTPKVNVVVDAYASQSDVQPAPVPINAVLEGDMQNGPTIGLANRGDSHLIVYDTNNNIGYEFYHASRPNENSDGKWHADGEAVWNFNTNEFRTIGYTSADAAGLAILPGLARPDEALPVAQGGQGVIDHALRFTLDNDVILNQFVYPASHIANPGNVDAGDMPPMGTRFRLKANVDISGLGPEAQVIAQAMKNYGLILADNGSNFFLSGASESVLANGQTLTWDDNDIQPDQGLGLKSLSFSDFEVVSLAPVVTGLSASVGAAGATLTITGQNFSGAAGHLNVLFGSTPASNVTMLDDGHVTAVVPPGAGTVDVFVVSGVPDPNDLQNINSPTFGYGSSTASAADRFTYVSPPTITSADQTAFLTGAAGSFTISATGGDPAPIQLSENGALPSGVTFSDLGNGVGILTGTPGAGTAGTWPFTIVASNGNNTASATQSFVLTVNPTGFDYVAATQALTITGTNFTFTQATTANAGGTSTVYLFTLDGTAVPLLASSVSTVAVNGQTAAAVAILVTNDTYIGTDNKTHETVQAVDLGQGGGAIYQYDANGNPFLFLQLSGFPTSYAYVGRADSAQLTGVKGQLQNTFVTAGNYSYEFGGGQFHLISGAAHIYGYAVNTRDQAWQYDAAGSLDAFVASGNAYSYMSGADTHGQSFFNVAVGFQVSYGIVTHHDAIAYLIDSPGNDVFVGNTTYSYLSGAGVFNVAENFNMVYGESFVGGTDFAYLYDTSHNIITGFHRLV